MKFCSPPNTSPNEDCRLDENEHRSDEINGQSDKDPRAAKEHARAE